MALRRNVAVLGRVLTVVAAFGLCVAAQAQGDSTTVHVGSAFSPSPRFAPHQTFPTDHLPISVSTADLNGDGKIDLVAANYYGQSVSVLLNATATGSTTAAFRPSQSFPIEAYVGSVVAGDVNGDGKPDLVVLGGGIGIALSVLVNMTEPGATSVSFSRPQGIVDSGAGPYSVVVADVNGDGKPDVVVSNYVYLTGFSVLLNTTTPGSNSPTFSPPQKFETEPYPYSVSVADVNGDGKPDVIVANQNDGIVAVFLNTTPSGAAVASFAQRQPFAAGPAPFWVTTADVNGDGKPDVVVANAGDSQSISVLLNTTVAGAGTTSFSAYQSFLAGHSPASVVTADCNGDGKPDLIVADYIDNTVSVLINTTAPGASTASFSARAVFPTGTNPISVAAADLNGDGKVDIITPDYGSDTVSVLLNTTASSSAVTAVSLLDWSTMLLLVALVSATGAATFCRASRRSLPMGRIE